MGNAASSVPYGAQSNSINIPLTCSYGAPDTFNTFISLTAPLSGGAGQQINFTDVTAEIRLPARFLVEILDEGAASYEANTTITFDTTNASPQNLFINQYHFRRNVSYDDTTYPDPNLVIHIPDTPNGVLDPLGPVTLGGVGQTDLRLQSVDFSFQAYKGNGNAIFSQDADVTCNPSPEPVLASIVVDDSPIGPLLAPANGAPGSFPSTGLGEKSTTAAIPVNCTQDTLIPHGVVFNYTFSGTSPLTVQNGQALNLSNVNNFVTLPGFVVGNETGYYGSNTCGLFLRLIPQNGLPGLGLSLANSIPGSIDVSNTFSASESSTPNPLVTGRYVDCGNPFPVTFPLPNTGYLNLTNIVASNQTGSVFSVGFDVIQGNMEGDNVQFGVVGRQKWICEPVSRTVLLSAPIM